MRKFGFVLTFEKIYGIINLYFSYETKGLYYMNANVRIEGIKIRNFKNVISGDISFDNTRKNYKASITGLYGQNGSGKTALIDSIKLLKIILSGQSIPQYYSNYINVNANFSSFIFDFIVNSSQGPVKVSYSFSIYPIENTLNQNTGLDDIHKRSIQVSKELIKCPNYDIETSTLGRASKLIDTDCDTGFNPIPKRDLLVGTLNQTELIVTKKIAEATSRSFIFSRYLLNIIQNHVREMNGNSKSLTFYSSILDRLFNFALYELFVLDTQTSGLINLNAQPFFFKYAQSGIGAIGSIMLPIDRPTIVPQKEKGIVDIIINNMNIVLCQIVPNMKIGINDLGAQVMNDGSVGERIQLVSYREGNSKPLPLSIESEGIKKIISVLQLLIVVYNDPSITLAVDELDSGIFEYLLGELLRIISERGKGQLIFTSHNLRILETIDRGFVAFTTTDLQNRYTKMTNIKGNNNLRDVYYRKIMLSDEGKNFYDSTRNSEIAIALKTAGGYGNGQKNNNSNC